VPEVGARAVQGGGWVSGGLQSRPAMAS